MYAFLEILNQLKVRVKKIYYGFIIKDYLHVVLFVASDARQSFATVHVNSVSVRTKINNLSLIPKVKKQNTEYRTLQIIS